MNLVDPTTAVGTGLVVLGSKDLLTKLLGPTADYVGGEVKNLVARCNINLDNVFAIAMRKLGQRADVSGEVSPRVLKHIIDEGRFCENELMAEYLGGVLASSKSDSSRDDRGSFYLKTITSLSSYQLRTHFLIHSLIVRAGAPHMQDLHYWFESDTISVAIPDDDYKTAMQYAPDEQHEQIAYHSFLGLVLKGLVEGGTRVVQPDEHSTFKIPFRYYWPARHGFELFLWGLGYGKNLCSSYFQLEPSIELPLEPEIRVLAIELGKKHFH